MFQFWVVNVLFYLRLQFGKGDRGILILYFFYYLRVVIFFVCLRVGVREERIFGGGGIEESFLFGWRYQKMVGWWFSLICLRLFFFYGGFCFSWVFFVLSDVFYFFGCYLLFSFLFCVVFFVWLFFGGFFLFFRQVFGKKIKWFQVSFYF